MNSTNLYPTLLAKSQHGESLSRSETLPGHIEDVMSSASAILERVGTEALQSTALQTFSFEDLKFAVCASALLHDLGKANGQFQRMVRGSENYRQSFRHEWLSVWLVLTQPKLQQWLFKNSNELIQKIVFCAVLGHHLKTKDGRFSPKDGTGDSELSLYCSHPHFQQCLSLGEKLLGLGRPPTLETQCIDLLSANPLLSLMKWGMKTLRWFQKAPSEHKLFLALIKLFLMNADVAGSALPKQQQNPATWATTALSRVCSQSELEDIVTSRLQQNTPRPFQTEVASSPEFTTFVRAGCGSGKTLAAYMWAARRAPDKQLFFCYPTTGTATEGFRDYAIPSSLAADARLMHSRSSLDIELILQTKGEDTLHETRDKVASLNTWHTPLIVCTVDQVLGLLQNQRRPIFAFPAIVRSAFIFDEIHLYDDRMFGCLLRFLEAFPALPVLLMTASLPTHRLQLLQKAVEGNQQRLAVIHGPKELETLQRYAINPIQTDIPWAQIDRAVESKQKILWVANTVNRCVQFAKQAQERYGQLTHVIPYHSRYRYTDRLQHHQQVIEAFQANECVIAVTTQVCEVSLDLSADLLISDLAPVPALIQRLGRLNRKASPKNCTPKPMFVLQPERAIPYSKEELTTAKQWLTHLVDRSVSQADLSRSFEELALQEPCPTVASKWLDGGIIGESAPFREAGYTIPIIRSEDTHRCFVNKQVNKTAVIGATIPMVLGPVSGEYSTWKQLGPAFIAPKDRILYSQQWGAQWQKK